MMVPNTHDLIIEVTRSQAVTARAHESRMTFAGTSYTTSARRVLAAIPATRHVAPDQNPKQADHILLIALSVVLKGYTLLIDSV
jgi:hypothetical protein